MKERQRLAPLTWHRQTRRLGNNTSGEAQFVSVDSGKCAPETKLNEMFSQLWNFILKTKMPCRCENYKV